MIEIKRDFLSYGNDVSVWIEDQIKADPLGRINQYTNSRREVGAQYTVPEIDIFKDLYDKIRVYGEPTDVWINYNPPGARNVPHFHIGADLAGCWYIDVPLHSGYLMFETGEKFEPKCYEFYVWDARKLHWVTTNLSESNRISIAFSAREKK